ncbi:hypothetical protein BESB_005400 [Besnoitia besnoiti]|uniref:Fanconi-associated nuclease n=1 Tax=Besnoitia besnoiti TaxID=94643 RepID=A0A2A9MJV8_BESBE|nr:hypothetical protein BESB_005400 [Besnoitia besnoiti]PFH38199.1 hypothetical protein BESB_005400 [Besnoitia besnoiti]
MTSRGSSGVSRRPGRRSFPFFLRNDQKKWNGRPLASSAWGSRAAEPGNAQSDRKTDPPTRGHQSTLLEFFNRGSQRAPSAAGLMRSSSEPGERTEPEPRSNSGVGEALRVRRSEAYACQATECCVVSRHSDGDAFCANFAVSTHTTPQGPPEVILLSSDDDEAIIPVAVDAPCQPSTQTSSFAVDLSWHANEGSSHPSRAANVREGPRDPRHTTDRGKRVTRPPGDHSPAPVCNEGISLSMLARPSRSRCTSMPDSRAANSVDASSRREELRGRNVCDGASGAVSPSLVIPGGPAYVNGAAPPVGLAASSTVGVEAPGVFVASCEMSPLERSQFGTERIAETAAMEAPAAPCSSMSHPLRGRGLACATEDGHAERGTAPNRADTPACVCGSADSQPTSGERSADAGPAWMWNFAAPVYACLEASCTFNAHLFSPSERRDLRRLARLLALPLSESNQPGMGDEESDCAARRVRGSPAEDAAATPNLQEEPAPEGSRELSPGARLLLCRLLLQFSRTPRRELELHNFAQNGNGEGDGGAAPNTIREPDVSAGHTRSAPPAPWLRLAALLKRSKREVADPQAALRELRGAGLLGIWVSTRDLQVLDEANQRDGASACPAGDGGASCKVELPGGPCQIGASAGSISQGPLKPIKSHSDQRAAQGASQSSTVCAEATASVAGSAPFQGAAPSAGIDAREAPTGRAETGGAVTCFCKEREASCFSSHSAAAATLTDSLIAALHCLTAPELQRVVTEVEAAVSSPGAGSASSAQFADFAFSPLAARLRRLLPPNRQALRHSRGERVGPAFKRRLDCLRFLCLAAEIALASHRKAQGFDGGLLASAHWEPTLHPAPAPGGGGRTAASESLKMRKLTHFFKPASSPGSSQGQPKNSESTAAAKGNGATASSPLRQKREQPGLRDASTLQELRRAAPSDEHAPPSGHALREPAEADMGLSARTPGEGFLEMLKEILLSCVGPLASFPDADMLRAWLVAFFSFHVVHSAFLNFTTRSAPPASVLWTSRFRPGTFLCGYMAPLDGDNHAEDRELRAYEAAETARRHQAEETVFSLVSAVVAPAVTRLSGLVTYQLQLQRRQQGPAEAAQPEEDPHEADADANAVEGDAEDESEEPSELSSPAPSRRQTRSTYEEGASPERAGEQQVLGMATSSQEASRAGASTIEETGTREGGSPPDNLSTASLDLCGACGRRRASRAPRYTQLEVPPLRCVCCCCEYGRTVQPVFPSRAALFVYAAALLQKWRLAAFLWGGIAPSSPARGPEEDLTETAVLAIVAAAAETLRVHVQQQESLLYRHLSESLSKRDGEPGANAGREAPGILRRRVDEIDRPEGDTTDDGAAEDRGGTSTRRTRMRRPCLTGDTERGATGEAPAESSRLREALLAASPPSKLVRFTPHYVWAATVSHGLELLEQTKRHQQAVELLRLLLRFHDLQQHLAHCVSPGREGGLLAAWLLRAPAAGEEGASGSDRQTCAAACRPDAVGEALATDDDPAGRDAFRRFLKDALRQEPARCRALSRRAGQWYNRLMVLLKVHLKRPLEALVAAVDCLREPLGAVPLAERFEVGKRATALAKTLALAADKQVKKQLRETGRRAALAGRAGRARRPGRRAAAPDGESERDAEVGGAGDRLPTCWNDVLQRVGRPAERHGPPLPGAAPRAMPARSERERDARAAPPEDVESRDRACTEANRAGSRAAAGGSSKRRARSPRSPPEEVAAAGVCDEGAGGLLVDGRPPQATALPPWTRFFPRDVHARLLETEVHQRVIETELPHTVVYARPLEASQQSGKSSVFFGWDGQLLSVEELCLQNYAMTGDWRGFHDEGRSLRTLFRLLMLDMHMREGDVCTRGSRAQVSEPARGKPPAGEGGESRDGGSRSAELEIEALCGAGEEGRSRETIWEGSADDPVQAELSQTHRAGTSGDAHDYGEATATRQETKRRDGREKARSFVSIVFLPPADPLAPAWLPGAQAGGGEEAPQTEAYSRDAAQARETDPTLEEDGSQCAASPLPEADSAFSSLGDAVARRERQVQKQLEALGNASRREVADLAGGAVRRLFGMRVPGVSWRGPWQEREEDEEAGERPADAAGDVPRSAQSEEQASLRRTEQKPGSRTERLGDARDPHSMRPAQVSSEAVQERDADGEQSEEAAAHADPNARGGNDAAATFDTDGPSRGLRGSAGPGSDCVLAGASEPTARLQRAAEREKAREACAQFFSMLAYGIGGKGLSEAFRLLSEDFAYWGGGLPDLLLWRRPSAHPQMRSEASGSSAEYRSQEGASGDPEAEKAGSGADKASGDASPTSLGEILFAEVKGPRDRLSEKQRCWLAHLLRAGVPCEVCKVLPPSLACNDRGVGVKALSRNEKGRRTADDGAPATGEAGWKTLCVSVASSDGETVSQDADVSGSLTPSDGPQRKTAHTLGLAQESESHEGVEEELQVSQREATAVEDERTRLRSSRVSVNLQRNTKRDRTSSRSSEARQPSPGSPSKDSEKTEGGARARKTAEGPSQAHRAAPVNPSRRDEESLEETGVRLSTREGGGSNRRRASAGSRQKGQRGATAKGLPRVRVRAEWDEHEADKVEALCRRLRRKGR